MSADTEIKNARRALRFAHFTNDIYASFMPTVMPLLIRQFSLSLSQAGFYSAFMALMSTMLQPLFGVLTDKTKTRAYVIWGPIVTGVLVSCVGFINEIWQLLALLFLASIGTAAFHPQGAALAGHLAKKDTDHSPSIAKFIVSGTLGASVSSYLAYFLLGSENNLQNLIYAAPFGVMGGLALAITLPKVTLHTQKKKFRARLWKVRARSILLLTLLVVFRSAVVSAFIAFLSEFYFEEHSQSLFFGALSILIFQMALAIGSMLGGYFEKHIGAANVFLYSFIAGAPLVWFFVETKSLVLLFLMGLVVNLSQAINISLAQKLIPQNAATVSSLTMGFGWGFAILFTPLVGHYADTFGLARSLEFNALIFLFCATLVILILKGDKNFKKII